MEFLDPKYHKAHRIRLIIGYVLVGIALVLTTRILLYQANGFGLKNGEVIQNGLIFVSSRPSPADIYVNGQKRSEVTNARLLMPAGQYTFELKRDGYRSWKRAINVEGGSVVRFDYPALFPVKLTTTTVERYDVQPPLATQSPDRRWLLVQSPSDLGAFSIYDLNNPEQAAKAVAIPKSKLILNEGLHHWKVLEWSNDNRHVLFAHSTDRNGATAVEFVLFDRDKPDETVNLTSTFGVGPTTIELRDKKYDQYYLYSETDKTLSTASLNAPAPTIFLKNVLAFKSHGDNIVLYATSQGAAEGKTIVKLRENDKTYTIRQVAADSTYLLDIARYNNAWYVVAGASSENRTYVYKNPAAALRSDAKGPLVPVQVLKAHNGQYVAFSDNARFIMVEGGQQFAIYDAENDRGYDHTLQAPIDAPQTHATWMDGHRLMAVSGGKVIVFDFDNANQQVLAPASAAFMPFFDRHYEFLYTINPQGGDQPGGFALTSTSLLTPEDQ